MLEESRSQRESYIRRCIELALVARDRGDTPVGSLIVSEGRIIAEGIEGVKVRQDITAHAELNAVREACRALSSLDLSRCALYTTAEPCWMCSYAIRQTRISEVIIGASVPYVGGDSSRFPILRDGEIATWVSVPRIVRDILRDECEALGRG